MNCVCFHPIEQHCNHCRTDHCLVTDCDCEGYEEMDMRKFEEFQRRRI